MPTRRDVLAAGVALCLGGALAGCGDRSPDAQRASGSDEPAAALAARPPAEPPPELLAAAPEPGTRPLGLEAGADPLLHVPAGLPAGEALPLVVTLHGAGGNAEGGLALLEPLAEEYGLVLLAPESGGSTWDAVGGAYGTDVELIDEALAEVFRRLPIDPGRVAVAGFSDGASYALGLGLANGRLFSRIAALSPGFVPPAPRSGMPEVFVSHGVEDSVLPVERTSRQIVPALREDGYEVIYREFPGPHTIPPEVGREAAEWLARS